MQGNVLIKISSIDRQNSDEFLYWEMQKVEKNVKLCREHVLQ